MLRLTLITVNSSCSLSNAKYVYIFALKFSDSSISKSSFTSISDIFKKIDIKTFPKSKDNNIRSVIAILCSISTILTFF